MSRQSWKETLFVGGDGTIINSTSTETIIFPDITIPANYMADQRTLHLIAYGRHTAASTPTLTFRVRHGGVAGTVICASGAMVTGTVTAGIWSVDVYIRTASNGSAGTLFGIGRAKINEDATQTVGSATLAGVEDFMGSAGVATPAVTAAVNLAADWSLSLTAQYGTAGSNTLTGHIEILESLN